MSVPNFKIVRLNSCAGCLSQLTLNMTKKSSSEKVVKVRINNKV